MFVRDAYGGKIRTLTMIDEYTHVCLATYCAPCIGAKEMIEQLADAMVIHSTKNIYDWTTVQSL